MGSAGAGQEASGQRASTPGHPTRQPRDHGNVPEAEGLCREALALQRKQAGDEHEEVAFSLGRLAVGLREEGKLVGADATFRRDLAMRRKFLGYEHPAILESLASLGF